MLTYYIIYIGKLPTNYFSNLIVANLKRQNAFYDNENVFNFYHVRLYTILFTISKLPIEIITLKLEECIFGILGNINNEVIRRILWIIIN